MERRLPLQIIDNYLPKDRLEYLKNLFFDPRNNFPWHFVNYISQEKDDSDFYFYHFLYRDGNITSNFFNKIFSLLIKKKIYRAKCNLYTKKDREIHTGYHIDLAHPHMVLLYNVNTNNGFTLFENGDKILSKENQAVIFDGRLRHKSVAQTDERVRININIDYEF